MYKIWAFLLLAVMGTSEAYNKVCYMYPQYGRKDGIECLAAKYCVCKADQPAHYEVESTDGRRTCHVRLDKLDYFHLKLFLAKHKDDMPISDETIKSLYNSGKKGLKSVGLILRDFKNQDKNVTVGQIRCAVGLSESK